MIQNMMEKPTLNESKKSLWCLLSRLKTGKWNGAIILENEFEIDTFQKAVYELLNEHGLTACPLWNITKEKHEVLFRRVKKIQNTPQSEVPVVVLSDSD